MNSQDLLKFCAEKGFLLDKEVLGLFGETKDVESLKLIIERVRSFTQKKIITKNVLFENKDKMIQFMSDLPSESQKNLESIKIKLGLSIEISQEISSQKTVDIQDNSKVKILDDVKILTKSKFENRKLEVEDFTKHFKERFTDLKNILQDHSDLSNLISINKISGTRQNISIIGMVYSKQITKNKNIILEVEDLTGKTKVLISASNKELYSKAEEILMDVVLGFSGSGSREMVFAKSIIFPEAMIHERKKSPVEEYALFIGDLHFGSKKFLKEGFLKFIDYLSGKVPNTPEVEKIKYLFLVGDIVTGVGNYPNQERDLEINDLEEQYSKLAEILGKIRRDIKIIISPGNHDGVRLMEPQPALDERYAWPLYNLKNVYLTENPSNVNIGSKNNFGGFNVLTYHGFSFPHYANNVPNLMMKKAMNCPEEIIKYLLKNRHLAPTHSSTQYYPLERDGLLIKDSPDIIVSGHTHKSAVTYYNNILIVSVSCWESLTPYQEKFGNLPDHCKVPMFNLKTREIKILDFE